MNIAIVEDEQMTREGLINIIRHDTEHQVVGWAEDGQKGIDLISQMLPDLIITDIQTPGKNGLEMLEELRKRGLEIPAVILTGYSDFEYARTAIKLGVAEYLLKPITVEELKQCFAKMEKLIQKDAGNLMSAQELLSLLLSCHDEQQKQELTHKLRIQLQVREQSQYAAVLIRPRSTDTEAATAVVRSITNTLEMLCYENSFVLRLPFDFGILILASDTEKNRRFELSMEKYVLAEIQDISECTGATTRFERLDELESSIHKMRQLMRYSLVLPVEKLISEDVVKELEFKAVDYPAAIESRMKQAVYQGNREEVLEAGRQFQEYMFAGDSEPAGIVEKYLNFLSNIYAVVQECHSGVADNEAYQNMLRRISNVYSKGEFQENFEEVINWIASADANEMSSQNLIVVKVLNYIRTHYNENISLTQMAEMTGVTPEYLSKLFTKETEVTFSTFLKQFRISTAKRLILTGKYKIQEVAEAVGFSDPKYFNRVFKEVCGVSPSEFKKGN